jgi:uncharacterized cysteine cluster protein YcgN (CxxCxxCC family)
LKRLAEERKVIVPTCRTIIAALRRQKYSYTLPVFAEVEQECRKTKQVCVKTNLVYEQSKQGCGECCLVYGESEQDCEESNLVYSSIKQQFIQSELACGESESFYQERQSVTSVQ